MRQTKPFSVLLFGIVSAAFGQQPAPSTPEDAYTSRELIAWSQLQKPQPTPQPTPPRQTPIPEPGQQPDQQAKPPADPNVQEQPALWFTGKIVKQGQKYLLAVSGNAGYLLESDADLGTYENREVRLFGECDMLRWTIRPISIRLPS